MIIFGFYGTAAALVIWIVKKDKSEYLKKSVKQAVAYQILALAVMRLMGLFWGQRFGAVLAAQRSSALVSVVAGFWALAGLALFLYGVIGAVAAFKGKSFKYALIGNFVDKILN